MSCALVCTLESFPCSHLFLVLSFDRSRSWGTTRRAWLEAPAWFSQEAHSSLLSHWLLSLKSASPREVPLPFRVLAACGLDSTLIKQPVSSEGGFSSRLNTNESPVLLTFRSVHHNRRLSNSKAQVISKAVTHVCWRPM